MPFKRLPGLLAITCVIAAIVPGVAITNAAPTGLIRATKTLYAFRQPPKNPSSLLLGSDGNFYGASGGGVFGFLFRVTPGGVFSVLHDSKDDVAGSPTALSPTSLILGKDGNLYGILSGNGAI